MNFLTARIERETVVGAGSGIEVRFVKYKVLTAANHGAIRDAEFRRNGAIVGQEPAADVHGGPRGIIKLDGIHRRQIAMGQRFVDDNAWKRRRRIICQAN